MSEYIQAVTAENFENVIIKQSYERPVIVDFWADWCGPCKQLMPVLHQLVENMDGAVALATINTDEQQHLAMQFGIRSLPTLLIFKNGEVVEQTMGVKPQSEITALLEPYLIADNDDATNVDDVSENIQKALDNIENGRMNEAIDQLVGDDSPKALTLLLKLYLQERQLENAKKLHSTFDDELKNQQEVSLMMHIVDLLVIEDETSNTALKNAIQCVVDKDAHTGIDLLLDLMSKTKDNDEKAVLKKSIVIGFNLVPDKAVVSKLRRQLSSMIFN